MKNLFDNDFIKINDLSFKYAVITLLVLIIIVVVINFLKKDYYYENAIQFIEKSKAVLMVEKKNINKLKNIHEVIVGEIRLNYNIEKIEERDNMYLVYVKFDCEIDNINESKYKVLFNHEKIWDYFVRIIRGG